MGASALRWTGVLVVVLAVSLGLLWRQRARSSATATDLELAASGALVASGRPAWQHDIGSALKRASRDPTAKYLQLGTVSRELRPRVRTVVFRGWLWDTCTLTFVTDLRSAKADEIAHSAHGEACWYFAKARDQFRIEGSLALVSAAEELGGEPLHLTACLLAKIFSRQITHWNHPEIRAVNKKLTATSEIKVVHRVKGSSSTAGFTAYMLATCPLDWTLGTGSTITWPAGTFEGEGSDGMSTFIEENEGAIGYIDAGHGHEHGLSEVALRNKDGVYLTTKTADIGAAATVALTQGGLIPTDPSADWSSVNLYNLSLIHI